MQLSLVVWQLGRKALFTALSQLSGNLQRYTHAFRIRAGGMPCLTAWQLGGRFPLAALPWRHGLQQKGAG